MSEPIEESRRARRLGLTMPARCRTLGGFIDDVIIRDVSPQGCRIVSRALTVRLAARVIIRPVGMEGLCATVRWINGHEAGVEFDQPLYGPVAEHMHRTFLTFPPAHLPVAPPVSGQYYGTIVRRLAA
ncbi:MAG: PilZ domain-containing protein [Alphaproteobacteria bacterium]|nr:PilZ domain-containing protein [Alphaproteobacteria bacterium]